MYVKWLPFFFVLTTLYASEMEFSSDEITVKGEEIFLKGHVSISHTLGKLLAGEATLLQEQGSSHQSSFILASLRSLVELQLSSDQRIHCDSALVDFKHRNASLSSNEKPIFFYDPSRQLTIQSQKVDCQWDTDEEKTSITSLSADDSVQISFGPDIFIHALNALYATSQDPPLSKHLSINHDTDDGLCLISIGEDLLKAKSAEIDLIDETLTLDHPIGKIATDLMGLVQPESISFSSSLLTWNRKTGEITLKEEVIIDGCSFGHLTTGGSVSFSTEKVDEQLLFKGFVSEGNSQLMTLGGIRLICDGQITFDHQKKHLEAVSLDHPIIFESGELIIETHRLTFDQLEQEPKTITFTEGVTFTTKEMIGKAGKLTYQPEEHKLEFSSTEKESVMFYNPNTDTKMVAEALTITKDPLTGENTVQGKGVVRLSFDHNERDKIIEVLHSCVKQSF